jgi:aspartyl protease family protein
MSQLDSSDIMQILFFAILLWFITRSFFSRRSSESPSSNILIWFVIFAILIVGYAFRFELDSFKERILAVLIPSYSWSNETGQLVIARHGNGHFYLDATTKNGSKINFLVDTGASDIALTIEDAKKLGFNPSKLKYTRQYSTANGTTSAAPVLIPQLTIGKRTFYNIEGHVTSGDLDISLLGMSLIDDFKDFKITQDMLILSH